MTFFIYAFAIFDQEYLRGFMRYRKGLSYFIGQLPVPYQVEEVKINVVGLGTSFQTGFRHAAGCTSGAVLKDQLCFLTGQFFYAVQLLFIREDYPIHNTIQGKN